ncbi:hypothetical protein LWI29_004233 [Acer saccharum]|uniref:CCHC-type domain-containing protein n=1 Tax=Acer saccharum TaxID=4024 RepID=A0AA39W0T6_ACESA|nr:hypothetical protein LWI29_004233 [Acer saccharum]
MHKGKKGNFQKGKWKVPKENLKKSENFKKGETKFQKRGKSAGFKKDKTKLKCYNCGKQCHFARECIEPKKIVNSGATDHAARDRATFVEYRRISQGTRWIYVGNNSRVEVNGIGTCKLMMHGGQVLYLQDVLYAPGIRRNLVSVIVLLGLGYEPNFYGRKPSLTYLRPWGCAGYVHDPSNKYGKLGTRRKKCIFIRYSEHSKGYVLIGENSNGSVTEIESRDVNFLESEFPKRGEVDKDIRFYELDNLIKDSNLNTPLEVNADLSGTSVPSGSETPLEVNIDLLGLSVHNGSNDVMETALLDLPFRRSNCGNVPCRRFEIKRGAFMVVLHDADEPKNVNEALKSPNKELWINAMKEKMDSMKSNHVWDLVDLPSGRKAIGNKWVIRIKRKADGTVERHKARLIVKGYTQQEGIDYEETITPVVRFASVRLILAIITHMDL